MLLIEGIVCTIYAISRDGACYLSAKCMLSVKWKCLTCCTRYPLIHCMFLNTVRISCKIFTFLPNTHNGHIMTRCKGDILSLRIYDFPTLQFAAAEYKINVINLKGVSSIVAVSSLKCFTWTCCKIRDTTISWYECVFLTIKHGHLLH